VSAVVSVSETFSGQAPVVLDGTDYELLFGGRAVQRVGGGSHSSYAWRGRVIIVATPVADTARRTRVELDLVQLALSYNALRHEAIGDYQATRFDDYTAERENILSVLEPSFSIA
jgi:RNA polymerase subunit RPABC4/transcription elongation factor Spt4